MGQFNSLSEEALLSQAKNGDNAAFDQLVTRHKRALYRGIIGILRNPTDAEDVVQETLLRAYRSLGGFRGESSFSTWLYRIGHNAAISLLVKGAREGNVAPYTYLGDRLCDHDSEEDTYGPSVLPSEDYSCQQLLNAISDALDQLPAQFSAAMWLRDFEGLSYEDIAVVQECPIGTVRSRIARARNYVETSIIQFDISLGKH